MEGTSDIAVWDQEFENDVLYNAQIWSKENIFIN
jgi:hypothetical protein